ncbi:MAG: F0F1 ATP synthase subunit B' [Alphaproteobacteria bacterium]|nr:F0F1 ATP synthase subunit B' [Alphaproteobacteria bacterium]
MPQLDFEFWPPQIAWLILSFVALYLLMERIALPRIAVVLEQRRNRIASDLDETKRLSEETKNAISAYEKALTEARAQAQLIINKNHHELQEELEKERAKVNAEIAFHIKESEERIITLKNAALSEMNLAAADTAQSVIQKLTNIVVSRDEIAETVNAQQKS